MKIRNAFRCGQNRHHDDFSGVSSFYGAHGVGSRSACRQHRVYDDTDAFRKIVGGIKIILLGFQCLFIPGKADMRDAGGRNEFKQAAEQAFACS